MKKQNPNITAIQFSLLDSPKTVAQLSKDTGLSADQVRRALKSMKVDVSATKPRVYSMPAKRPRKERITISSTARRLILEGKTNAEVLEALTREHDVDPTKRKHYPSWFRAQLVRQGEVERDWARSHAHKEV